MRQTSRINKVRFLLHLGTTLQKERLASPSIPPTMMVFMGRDTPNLSKVNWVRQQNICIMNISSDPPSKALSQLGIKMLLQFLSLNLSLFCVKFYVYLVRKSADRAYTPVRGHSKIKNILSSPQSRKYNPKVISLATHPNSTFTQLCSLLRLGFQFRNRNVRLLRGPMHKLAAISPAQRLKYATTALTNNNSELIRKSGLLPTRSEITPVRKLPTAQATKVQRVRVSRSSMLRKMTLRTNSPESQNQYTSAARKR